MISDIERCAKSPTISTLASLAEALQVPLGALVEPVMPGRGPIYVQRAAQHSPVTDSVSGSTRVRIGPTFPGSKLEILRLTLPPHSLAGPYPAHPRGTMEHVYLARGDCIRVTLGTDTVTLETGDSCTCLAEQPHSFDNRASYAEALIYLVIEPPQA
jgi:quercetin dioxygenase-like cupin family protein